MLSVMTILAGCAQGNDTEASKPIVTLESVSLDENEKSDETTVSEGSDTTTEIQKENDETEKTDAVEENKTLDKTDVTGKAESTAEAKTSDEDEAEKTNDLTGRKDGERFESTLMLEGMEETIKCEHIRNEELGFELDYDYETFSRKKEADYERLLSIYDDADEPYNYLDVTFSKEEGESVSKTISEELSKEYDISQDSFKLENAGGCIRINASTTKAQGDISNLMQVVYIIPTSEGSLIATAHYTFESAEGFGTRMADIVNTINPIAGK